MKARVKATGEIVEVNECGQTFKDMRMDYMDMRGCCYRSEDLDFSNNTPFDYWTCLEHKAAIAAMQGILSNPNLAYKDISTETICNYVVERVKEVAHALVEKYKKEK